MGYTCSQWLPSEDTAVQFKEQPTLYHFISGLVVAVVIGVVLGIALGVVLLTVVMMCQRR